jgi:hypothetical protein
MEFQRRMAVWLQFEVDHHANIIFSLFSVFVRLMLNSGLSFVKVVLNQLC